MNKKRSSKSHEHKRKKITKRYVKRKRMIKLWTKRFFMLFSLIAILVSIVVALKFALDSVFKVKNISVQGSTLYDDSEIVKASGIKVGDSIIFSNMKLCEENICKNLDYVDSAKINRDFFGNVTIELEAAKVSFSINQDEKYYLISEKDKILEISEEIPPEIVVAQGIDFEISENKVKYSDETKKQLFFKILNQFKEQDLNYVKKIDVTNCENLEVLYDDRLNILLGSDEELKYKVSTAKEIITGKLSVHEKGKLDLRSLKKENRSYFIPE